MSKAFKMTKLQKRISDLVAQHGSYRAAGRVTKVRPEYLCRMFLGTMTNPSDETLKKLGLKRTIVVTYVLLGL